MFACLHRLVVLGGAVAFGSHRRLGEKWDGEPYKKVDARSAKEAAEKLYARPLQERGNRYQLRAQVRIAGESGV
jgi:hypothetical protein